MFRSVGGRYILHVDLVRKRLADFLNIPKSDRYNVGDEKEIGGLYEMNLLDGEPCDIAVIVPIDLTRYKKNDPVPCEILMDEEHTIIDDEIVERVRRLVTVLTGEGISVNSYRKVGADKHRVGGLAAASIR